MVKHIALISSLLLTSTAYAKTLKPSIETLNTALSITHPVYSLKLNPNDREMALMVLGVDDAKQRHLAIFARQANVYTQRHQVAIPDNFHVFDFAKSQNGHNQAVYFIASDGLYTLDLTQQSAKFTKLVALNSIYLNDKTDFVSQDSFVFDTNNDGRSEFAIQQFRTLAWVAAGETPQSYTVQQLPIPATAIFEGSQTRILKKPVFITDTNQDGMADINLLHDGAIQSYQQQNTGKFADTPTQLAINPQINDIDWWFMNGPDGNSLDQSTLSYRRIETFADVNNDALPDLVVRLTKSGSALDRRNDYELYLGEKINQQLSFAAEPSSVIARDETLSGLTLVDFNNDKRKEFLLSGFDIGVSQIISALLSSAIDQDVLLFSLDDNSKFGEKPLAKEETELKFKLTSGKAGEPVIRLADLNGDNVKDLVLSDDDNKLRVYFAANNSGFKRRGDVIKVELPENGKNLTASDLNGDGRDELVINFGQGDDKSQQNKVLILSFGEN